MIEQDFEALCKQNKFSIEKIRRKNRIAEVVEQRRVVAIKLRDKGYTCTEIGDVMHKDHSAIVYMTNLQFREEKKFKMRDRYSYKKPVKKGK